MSPWVAALSAFVAVAFGVVAFALLLESVRALSRRRSLQARLDATLADLQEQTLVERELVDSAKLRHRKAEELAERLPVLGNVPLLLSQARLTWTPLTFVLISAGLALGAGVFAMLLRMALVFAVLLAALGGALPYAYASHRRSRALARFEELLPEAIDYLARAIRAGHPLSVGIQMVGEEMAEPLASEFRTVFEEQRFGVPFEEALLGMCDRVNLVDVRIFATSVIVQREAGGANFGEVLDNMAETIRTRFAIRREIRVYTAQGRMSGMVISAVPILIGLFIYAQDPSYIGMLFDHPVGRFMSVTAVVMQVIGFLWIRKIVNVEI